MNNSNASVHNNCAMDRRFSNSAGVRQGNKVFGRLNLELHDVVK